MAISGTALSSDALTRRQALKLGAATTLVAALGRTGTAFAAGAPLSCLRRSSYTALVAETFVAAGAAMTLVDLADVAGASKDRSLVGEDDVFVLTFEGPAGIDAGIHPLHHPDLGAFSLYLGPVGDAGKTQQYEAVIDRSIKRPRDPATPAAPQTDLSADAPTAEPTLEQEHAAYVAAAEQGVALAREARAEGHDVSLAVAIPTKQQVRKLRKARKKAKAPAAKRRPARKPAAPRRAAKPAARRGSRAATRR